MKKKREKKAPVIEIKDLTKEFRVGDKLIPVLRGVDLQVHFGEFTIIYGPSGCGKTTLLNIILGMEIPSSGLVIVKGENLFEKTDEERTYFRQKRFGIVFQQAYWIKSLNVVENAALPLNIAGLSKQRALERAQSLLKLLDIENLATRFPTDLSGGEQQRVGVARALATNPWMIIADEPTGNLDEKSGIKLMDLFKSLNERAKRTIVLVTHNPEYKKYASQLIYLADGKVIKSEVREQTAAKPTKVAIKVG